MSEPYLGQIMMVGFNFAPVGWALCDGQLLAVSQNSALFSLLGTFYGGDGETTFGLPDMRGRFPTHHGTGPGLSPVMIGQKGGAEDRVLTIQNLPPHNHNVTLRAVDDDGDNAEAAGKALASSNARVYSGETPDANMAAGSISQSNVGNGTAVNIMNPYLAVGFCIAVQGIFPSRN